MTELVRLDWDDRGKAGRIARVVFDNPEKRNALGLEGKRRFIELLTSLRHAEGLRALVITGSGGKSFVGGTNIAEMAAFTPEEAEASATLTHRVAAPSVLRY